MKNKYKNIEGWFDFQPVYDIAVDNAKDESILVELGSWKGMSACYMLERLEEQDKDVYFVCIDTWTGNAYGQDGPPDDLHSFVDNLKEQGYIVKDFLKPNLWDVKPGGYYIAGDSSKSAEHFIDETIDFVFIDACHNYAKVLEDLNSWFPKVKPGGYLGGHDYPAPSIRQAVKDFNNGRNLQVQGIKTSNENDNTIASFLIRK